MKTILISSFHPLISRNILQTSVLKDMIAQGVNVILLVPQKKIAYFEDTFGGPSVSVVGVVLDKKPLEDLLYLFSLSVVGVENHIVRGWKTQRKYFKYYAGHLIHRLFSGIHAIHVALRVAARTYLRSSELLSILKTHRPDLVFTTDTFNPEDRTLLLAAKEARIPTVGMIRSWDNATTKGVLLAVPDRLIVTNEVLKEEMEHIHRISPDLITVTGVPPYDMAKVVGDISREAFLTSVGLDPKKKTILFAPGGKILYEHDREVLTFLKTAADAGLFACPVQFLVRIPPSDVIDAGSVAGDSRFAIDNPGTNITGRKKDSELSEDDNVRLKQTLSYSDVVITLVSTMVIDGMVYDKPVVVLGFEPAPNLPDSIVKFSKYLHFEKLLQSGLVTVSHTKEEFIDQVNDYLAHPEHDAEKRTEVLRRYVYALDGASGHRVAQAVLACL